MIERFTRKSLVASAAAILAALGLGGAAIAQSGSSATTPQKADTPAAQAQESPGREGPESNAPENSATDPDNVQDESGKDDATEASEQGKEQETPGQESKEVVNDDGPGGHADEQSGQPNADHQFEGKE
jgi:hypothetical protein